MEAELAQQCDSSASYELVSPKFHIPSCPSFCGAKLARQRVEMAPQEWSRSIYCSCWCKFKSPERTARLVLDDLSFRQMVNLCIFICEFLHGTLRCNAEYSVDSCNPNFLRNCPLVNEQEHLSVLEAQGFGPNLRNRLATALWQKSQIIAKWLRILFCFVCRQLWASLYVRSPTEVRSDSGPTD